MADQQQTYDTPKPSANTNYDMPRPWSRTPPQTLIQDDSYDIPRPSTLVSQNNMTPSSSNSSLLISDSLSFSSSNRSSLANMPDYDIPRKHPQAVQRSTTPLSSANSTYDIPQMQTQSQHSQNYIGGTLVKKELPLELSSAMETLSKLQNETTSAITR